MAAPQADGSAPAPAPSRRGPAPDTGERSTGQEGRGVRALRFVGRALMAPPWILRAVPPLAWGSLIFFLSSFQPRIGGIDVSVFGGMLSNLLHPGAFGILALLLVPALTARKDGWTTLTPERGLWVVVIATLYGFTDELHQSVVEGRDASLLDLVADFVGALFTVRVILLLGRPDADRRRLHRLCLWGLLASVAAAAVATAWNLTRGDGPWPF